MTSTEPTLWDNADADVVPAIVEQRGGEVAELVELAERARDYALSSKAANTLRAYESDLRQFAAWCEARGLGAFPAEAETVALYLTVHAGRLANDGVDGSRALAGLSVRSFGPAGVAQHGCLGRAPTSAEPGGPSETALCVPRA